MDRLVPVHLPGVFDRRNRRPIPDGRICSRRFRGGVLEGVLIGCVRDVSIGCVVPMLIHRFL